MSKSEKSRQNLSSTQKKVKQPRRCIYSGENKNTNPELARDILSLYITCRLGYSAIRHVLGLSTDKKVEDVIRQHMLGRKGVDGTIGELSCPGSTEIYEYYKGVITEVVKRYGTESDPYVVEMLTTGKWKDDPVVKKQTTCLQCGKELQDDWISCPYCGKSRRSGTQRSLFDDQQTLDKTGS